MEKLIGREMEINTLKEALVSNGADILPTEYVIDKSYAAELHEKLNIFKAQTKTK